MELRPHHLLCTLGYSGKGYSREFVSHMDEVTRQLRSGAPITVNLTFSTDTLCSCCPHMQGPDLCDTNKKVKEFDRKVIEYFALKETAYIYQDLIAKIKSQITEDMLADICTGCEWYPVSACRKNILSK